jgi:hypothetical protein
MNTQEFVASWKQERENYLVSWFGDVQRGGKQLESMGLSDTQKEQMWQLLDTITTDIMYTLLLGLDGSAAIGNSEQQAFKIFDENGNLISDCGELESEAFEQFHGTHTDISDLQRRSLALLQKYCDDQSNHEVFSALVGAHGIAHCPHCGKSFHINSARSWNGKSRKYLPSATCLRYASTRPPPRCGAA